MRGNERSSTGDHIIHLLPHGGHAVFDTNTERFLIPPGWRRSRRRRSSSGKGRRSKSPPVWPSWGPSRSPPTCWRRRRTRTCCLSEAPPHAVSHRRHSSSYLFCASPATSMSSYGSDGSCFCFFCVCVSVSVMICSVVPVLDGLGVVSLYRKCWHTKYTV